MLLTVLSYACMLRGAHHFYMYDTITPESTLQLQVALRTEQAAIMEANQPIHVHVFSGGGSVAAGLFMYDMLRAFPTPVYTYVEGFCGSAATLVTLAGSQRFMTPHSHMLLHEPSIQIDEAIRCSSLMDRVQNIRLTRDAMVDVYLDRTSIKSRALNTLLRRDECMNAMTCQRLGLVDHVV